MIIKDLCLKFNDKVIFDKLNLEIGDGITCIMADSGKGKTSLLRIIGGLLKADGGEIINEYKRPAIMFQEDRVLPWFNVLENVKLVCDDEQVAKKYLDLVGLKDNYNSMPKELSGGMERRVALARALAYKSDYLILDEPFKGMDARRKESIIKYLISLNKPIIMATHSLNEAKLLKANIINL